MPDASFALYACPSGWHLDLASPVYDMQSGVHRPPAFRPALSPDAPGGRPRCPVGYARWPQFGAVRGDLPYLAHGPLSPGLRTRTPEPGRGADTVWSAAACLFSG